jgi:myo-inositol-1(or 4)-monophosphatase
MNFLHGQPHWAVSIALEHKREIVAAVTYDPVKDEMFVAEKGAGAWLNDRRMRVSGRREVGDMFFGTGVPSLGRDGLPATLRDFAALAPRAAGVRASGASTLDLAYVAAGRLDAFWHRGLQPWDLAAGDLLVREAGGFVAPLREGGTTAEGDVLAGNAAGFEAFAGIIRSA